MKTVRWAILGAGHIAKSFVKDFPLLRNASLVAVASSSPERGAQFAAMHSIPAAINYSALYTSNEIDAVYIATTHNFHFEQARQCLLHGKSVLCEKPITINTQQFETLALLAKEKNLFLMEAMWTYFLPAIQQAKKWLDDGRIGALKLFQSDFGFAMEKKLDGRLYNPKLAGGALLDLGVYPLAMAHYFTGLNPGKIYAAGNLAQTGVDETISLVLQYDGITASLNTSMVTHLANCTRLYGENGYMEIPEFWKAKEARLFGKDHELLESFNDGRTAHGFVYEMQHANDCILAGKHESPVMPHRRSYNLQQAMLAIRKQVGVTYPGE